MWITPDDAPRYQELTETLLTLFAQQVPQQAEQPVVTDDLALYLEWLELAREAAPCIRPFIDKSSPFAFQTFSYRELENDFRWLREQVTPESLLTYSATL
jgi:hypothetical protein